MPDSYYLPDGELYVATELTRGPWHRDHQHGGPPAALLAGSFERWGDDAERWFLARLQLELLRPALIAPMRLELQPVHLGRGVQRLEGRVFIGDDLVIRASALRILRRPTASTPPLPYPDWPSPDACPRMEFDFFPWDVGYHRTLEGRVVHGVWGRVPIGVWTRAFTPLVPGRPLSPTEHVALVADAQSGLGVPLDPTRYVFLNPDMAVFYEREPVGEWLGFDVRSTANAHGSGLSQSEVRDLGGVVARSAQTLVVTPRS